MLKKYYLRAFYTHRVYSQLVTRMWATTHGCTKKHIIKKSSIRHLNMGTYGGDKKEIFSNQRLSTHNVIC